MISGQGGGSCDKFHQLALLPYDLWQFILRRFVIIKANT